MKLHKLTLQNFCGIKDLALDFGGASAKIYGANGIGKSTTANAFAWLLYDKDLTAQSKFDPTPLDVGNKPVHNLETSVEAVVEHEGKTKVYKKVLTEVWRKPRGAKESELTGNKTDYFIDGVPMKESEYVFELMNIAQSEILKMLSSLHYFASMAWQTRRKFLIDICGDVSDDDVISSNLELAELPAILGSYTVEEFLKVAKSKKSQLKKEIDEIPGRITENENAIPELTKPLPVLEEELQAYETAKAKLQAELAEAKTDEGKISRINELKAKMYEKRSDFLAYQGAFNDKINADIKSLEDDLNRILKEKAGFSTSASKLKNQLEDTQKKREKLLAKHKEISTQSFSEPDICPTCGQGIPEERRQKALEEFNSKKSKELEAIVNTANSECHKDMIAKIETELQSAKDREADCAATESKLNSQIAALREQLDSRKFEDSDEYKKLSAVLNSVENSDSDCTNTQEITAKIASIAESISTTMTEIAAHKAAEKCHRRIEELQEQHKTLAEELSNCEKGEYLCELFIRTKVSLLDDRINSKFKNVRFRLFNEQKNGGIAETCEVLIPCESALVDYFKANKASRFNAGLEIINALSEHFQLELPVFADDAEGVTDPKLIPQQVILLTVSRTDKQLRIEKI